VSERRVEMNPVMLATDGSPTAGDATKVAIELAGALGAPLLVVSCWEIEYAPVGNGFAPVIPDFDRIGRERTEEVVDKAADAAREAGLSAMTLVRRGDPAREICAIASDRDVRLIVLGSHGWGPLRRFVFGSVSTGVLHHAQRPVLVVPNAQVAAEVNGQGQAAEVGGGR
jgi:nucleotide-binding universal stress UspA family protein